MPAKSVNQAIAMNLAQAVQKGQATAQPGSPSAQIAGSMKPSDVADFASTPQAGLPKRVAPPAAMPPRAMPPPTVKRKPMRVKNVGKPVKKFKF
jgi:hypothetical protein